MNMEEMIRNIIREELENIVKENSKEDHEEIEEVDISEEDKNIDRILFGGKKPQRVYRGFYWDQEIIDFLDNVQHGNKSDLMNEIVKTVLQNKGLI